MHVGEDLKGTVSHFYIEGVALLRQFMLMYATRSSAEYLATDIHSFLCCHLN
jgi:hypothetical protein